MVIPQKNSNSRFWPIPISLWRRLDLWISGLTKQLFFSTEDWGAHPSCFNPPRPSKLLSGLEAFFKVVHQQWIKQHLEKGHDLGYPPSHETFPPPRSARNWGMTGTQGWPKYPQALQWPKINVLNYLFTCRFLLFFRASTSVADG